MLKWANPVYHIILMMSQNLSHGFIHTTLLQWVIVDFLVCPLVLLLLKVMALTEIGSHYAEVVLHVIH